MTMLRLRPTIFLPASMPWLGGGDVGGGLDALGVDEAGGRFGRAAFGGADQAAQQAVELGEDALVVPGAK